MRESLPSVGAPPAGIEAGAPGNGSGNGSHEAPPPPPAAAAAPVDQPREAAPTAPPEYRSEPRESAGTHEAAPIAHFEPAPKPESAGSAKPYVVWSSAPPKDGGGGREE